MQPLTSKELTVVPLHNDRYGHACSQEMHIQDANLLAQRPLGLEDVLSYFDPKGNKL